VAGAVTLVAASSFESRAVASAGIIIHLPRLAPGAVSLLDPASGIASGSGRTAVPDGVVQSRHGDWKAAVGRRAAAAIGLPAQNVDQRLRVLSSKRSGSGSVVPVAFPVNIVFEATGSDPAAATRLANAFVGGYIAYRRAILRDAKSRRSDRPRALRALAALERDNVVADSAPTRVVSQSPHAARDGLLAAVLGCWAGAWLALRRRPRAVA
jgi:hypothetical protein